MARRGHGEGSITRRKDGRYQAALTLENHKRKYFYGETRKEVQDKLNKALYEQKQGTLATGPRQTLKSFLEQWLETTYKPPLVSHNTYKQFRSIIKKHLVPGLGHVSVQKLTVPMVQAFYREKIDAGLAPRTIATIHAVLHRALEYAVRWGLISRNVTKLVSLPQIERYEGQVLTIEKAAKLLEVARGSRIDALLWMALTTGMRRGEMQALRWSDIDIEKGVLSVQRTVSRIPGYGYVEGEPKTRSSRRKIVLPAVMVEALRAHHENQKQARVEAGDKWKEKGIVFCNIYGGFMRPDMIAYWLDRLLKDAGLPHMRFHDLRHSAATILLAAGVNPKVIQELLGHSKIGITLDVYSHVLPSMHQEAASKMDDLFKRS
jgi:integrase